jgi:hypothetical protein
VITPIEALGGQGATVQRVISYGWPLPCAAGQGRFSNHRAVSIREFGFTNPVLIDEEDGIIAGHGRVLGAQERTWARGSPGRRRRGKADT